jgi:hypothetical protein
MLDRSRTVKHGYPGCCPPLVLIPLYFVADVSNSTRRPSTTLSSWIGGPLVFSE